MILYLIITVALMVLEAVAFFFAMRGMRKELYQYMEGAKEGTEDLRDTVSRLVKELDHRLLELENGLVPDYEAARAAVKSVNDFNMGLSAIMGYDPMEAAKKAREKSGDA